jgi:surface antigen
MTTEQTWALRYAPQFEAGTWRREDAGEKGLTDALLMVSMVFPPDGSFSGAVIGHDGRTGDDLAPLDMWRAWLTLTNALARTDGLPDEYKHQIARALKTAWDLMERKAPIVTVDL